MKTASICQYVRSIIIEKGQNDMSVRLTQSERRVLAHLELAADVPLTEVARTMGVRMHTLRYALERLRARGIVSKRPFVNIYALGFSDYALFFSLAPEHQRNTTRFLKALALSDRVSWLATFGGDYHYGMSVSARSPAEVQSFLEQVSEAYPGIFYRKSLSVRTALTLFPRKYLSPGESPKRMLRFGYGASSIGIDQKDHRILHGLEQFPDFSLRDLAKELQMPLTTLQQRVAALKSTGVIVGSLYQIDATKFGVQAFRLLIEAKSVSRSMRERLLSFCATHRCICYLVECLGAWDYEVGLEVAEGSEAVEVAQLIQHQFLGDLARVQILPLFGHTKIRNYPFVKGLP
jgi:DNA-binding Lrp family transcriptional regulator